MAEVMMLVCDDCGEPATATVILRSGSENMAKDVCDEHYDAIYENAHKPKRGRKPAAVNGSGKRRRKAA